MFMYTCCVCKRIFYNNSSTLHKRSEYLACSLECRGKAKVFSMKRRFLTKIEKTETCWVWTGFRDRGGYGRVHYVGRKTFAHILSYQLFVGDTGNKCVLHKCDNPSCVNPDHLFLGTRKDNAMDMISKGRSPIMKLNPEKAKEVRKLFEDGFSMSTIASMFNVSKQTIFKIVRNKAYTES